jgi:queuosine precursor transporter
MFAIEKFDLLVAIYVFCICIAELMGAKTFPLANIFGYQLNASVAILVLPLIFTINDIISEVHGKERAKSVVRSGLLMIIGIFVFSLIATLLPPSARFKTSEAAYDAIFGMSARIAAASLTAFAFSDFLDVYIFARIRQAFGKKRLWLRNNLSNFIAQFIDTFIFMVLAFYSFDRPLENNVSFLTSLIIPYWLLKCSISIIETPLVYLGVNWLKNNKNS